MSRLGGRRTRIALGVGLALALLAAVAAVTIDHDDNDGRTVEARGRTGPADSDAGHPIDDAGTVTLAAEPPAPTAQPTADRAPVREQDSSTSTSTTTPGTSTTTTTTRARLGPTDDLLVIDHGSLVRVDTASGTVGEPIDVGFVVSSVIVTPDGSTAYVGGWRRSLVVLSLADDSWQSSIDPGFSHIGAMAMTPDGRILYVAGGEGDLARIDLETGTVSPPMKLGGALAMSPDGDTAYVARWADDGSDAGRLVPIDVATNEPGETIPIKGWPSDVAVSADGHTVFVQMTGPGCSYGRVVPVTVPEGRVDPDVAVKDGAEQLSIVPGGRTLYVNSNPCNGASVVSLVDAAGRSVIREIAIPDRIWPNAVSLDERFLYVGSTRVRPNGGSEDGKLHIVDLDAGAIVRSIELRAGAWAITVIPAR